jgi:hypothetical protein
MAGLAAVVLGLTAALSPTRDCTASYVSPTALRLWGAALGISMVGYERRRHPRLTIDGGPRT